MASRLYQQLMKNSLTNNNLADIYKASSNPQELINILARQNPQIKSIIQMVNSSGKSPKDLFYQKAQEMGVDPETILKQLR